MNKLNVLVFFVLLISLIGCGRTVTTTLTDASGNQKIIVEEKSFFSSENLESYYENDNKRSDNYARVVDKKIDTIKAGAAERRNLNLTPSEALLAGVIDTLSIAMISNSAPPPSSAPPKTMTDAIGGQAVALTSLGIGLAGAAFDWDIGGPFGSSNGGDGSTSLKEVTVGRDLYINGDRKDQYYLEEGAGWYATESTNLYWNYETYTGNAQAGGEGGAQTTTTSDDDMGLF